MCYFILCILDMRLIGKFLCILKFLFMYIVEIQYKEYNDYIYINYLLILYQKFL